MSRRCEYIDIAKGLGILAVIWGHIIVGHWTGKLVYSFHMPLFFFISGMLFVKEKYLKFGPFVKVRARRLLVPYVCYSVITWGIWALFHWITRSSVDSYWAPLLQTVLAQGSGQFMVHNSPLWFIPCLFAVELMYYPISKFKDVWVFVLSMTVCGISIALEHSFGDSYLLTLPWNLDAAMMALPFYAMGNLWMRHTSLEKVDGWIHNHSLLSIGLVLILTAGLVAATFHYPGISMGYSDYGNEYVFHARALLGIGSTIVFSSLLTHTSFIKRLRNSLSWLGRMSLDIMCIHVPVKGILLLALAFALNSSATVVGRNFYYALAVFAVTLLAVTVMVRWIDRGRELIRVKKCNG